MKDGGAFEDRRDVLFGRMRALETLRRRAEQPGLTALVGRPQAGKSWLVEELGRTLTDDHHCIVGYHQSSGASDNVLRAVQDLYGRWLSNSTFREQARAAYRQQSGGALSGTAKVLADVFGDAPGIAKPIGTLAKSAIDGLLHAREDLQTGRLVLTPIQYEQAKDLLTLVHEVSKKPLILFLDAWEQTVESALRDERVLLHGFVRDLDSWPSCHVFVVLRPESPALQHVQAMHREFGSHAEVVELGDLELSEPDERQRLATYLHKQVPVTAKVDDGELISLIDGYAGVVGRWLKAHTKPTTAEALRQLAKDSHANRYPELVPLIDALADEVRDVAMRIALMDNAGINNWDALETVIMNGRPLSDLDLLRRDGVLEASDPPTYGHTKRAEVAREVLAERYSHGLQGSFAQLIGACAAQVVDVDEYSRPFVEVVRDLGNWADASGLCKPGTNERRLIHVAMSLFRESIPTDALVGSATAPLGGALLAIGLFNTLNHAEAEDDLPRRDALLDELRALADAHDEPAVRERLAKGLFNTLVGAKAEDDLPRRDALLDELRALADAHDEPVVRESLARGLFNTLNGAKAVDDLPRRDASLDELRALADAHDEPAVRERLAKGLANTLIDAKAEDDLPRRDALLDELRALADAHDEPAVRESLAKAESFVDDE